MRRKFSCEVTVSMHIADQKYTDMFRGNPEEIRLVRYEELEYRNRYQREYGIGLIFRAVLLDSDTYTQPVDGYKHRYIIVWDVVDPETGP